MSRPSAGFFFGSGRGFLQPARWATVCRVCGGCAVSGAGLARFDLSHFGPLVR